MRCVQTTRLTCMIELFQNKKWQKKMMMMTQVNQNYYLLRATSKLYWSPKWEQDQQQKKEKKLYHCETFSRYQTLLKSLEHNDRVSSNDNQNILCSAVLL